MRSANNVGQAGKCFWSIESASCFFKRLYFASKTGMASNRTEVLATFRYLYSGLFSENFWSRFLKYWLNNADTPLNPLGKSFSPEISSVSQTILRNSGLQNSGVRIGTFGKFNSYAIQNCLTASYSSPLKPLCSIIVALQLVSGLSGITSSKYVSRTETTKPIAGYTSSDLISPGSLSFHKVAWLPSFSASIIKRTLEPIWHPIWLKLYRNFWKVPVKPIFDVIVVS